MNPRFDAREFIANLSDGCRFHVIHNMSHRRICQSSFRLALAIPSITNKTMKSKILSFAVLASIFLISPLFSQIEAGQSIIIKIKGVPVEEKAKVDDIYPVSKDGKVNLPFVGEIQAAGLDADQLAKSIEKAYRDGEIYTDAAIEVITDQAFIDDFGSRVHIGGQVKEPGPMAFTKNLTVEQAVQAVGGPTEFAAMDRVLLLRNGKQKKIDLSTAEGKGVITMPNDTIEVPAKKIIGKYISYTAVAIIIAALWRLAKFRRDHRLINRIGLL